MTTTGARSTPSTLLPAGVDPERVLAACRERRSEMERRLRRLVSLETPSLEPQTQQAAFALLAEALEEAGLGCRRRSGETTGGVLLARPPRPRPDRFQLLVGHCDTVWPVGTLDDMPVRVEDDVLHGPGSFDMKAGLIQGVTALAVLGELEVTPPVTPVFLVNSDEEIGSVESEREIRRLARISDRAWVLEPSLAPDGRLKTRRKGVAQYSVTVSGRAAHAGLNPEQGVSAIHELSLLVPRIFELNDPDRGVSVNVGTIDGGMRPNVIAPRSRAVIDVRVPTHEDADRIDEALRSLRASRTDVTVEVEQQGIRPPLVPSAAGRKLWSAARGFAELLGFALEEGLAGGGSDGNLTNELTPTLDGLGAVGDGAHASHEHVRLDAMVERTALMTLLLTLPPVDSIPEAVLSGEEP